MDKEIQQAWSDLIEQEEDDCWVIWAKEREANTPVVEVVITIDALYQEVR